MRLVLSAVGLALMLTAGPVAADVVCVQSRLVALGYDPGPVDGQIGGRTRAAVAAYAEAGQSSLPEFSDETSAQWCSELASMTAGMPGFELDKPPGVDLFDYGSTRYCQRLSHIASAPSSPVVDRKREVLADALGWFNTAISGTKAQPEMASDMADELVKLASNDAFVRLDWRGSGSSPAHWQLNLLKNIGFAVNIVDHFDAWRPGQRAGVVRWGDKVYVNTHYSRWGRKRSQRWPDTVATAAAAYVSWGVVAPNGESLADGQRDFEEVAKLLQKRGGTHSYFGGGKFLGQLPDDWGARIEDKMLGDLVIAAHAAGRSGLELFNHAPAGVSLYEAIVGWQETLFSDDGAAVEGDDLSFLTTNGQERSWSWTEYFVYNYPDDERSKVLRERSALVARGDLFGYKGLATGPSSCLFR